MILYPYSTPLILNDSIFVANGGQTGTFSAAQRQSAYIIAEQQATNYIGTFLLPTIVTGTYPIASRITTDYGYVHQIYNVTVFSKTSDPSRCSLNSNDGCGYIWDDTFGYIDVQCLMNSCGCGSLPYPYQTQISYQAGLPTGTANQPAMLLALTMAAQLSLNEMIYPSQNEGTGDIGISEFHSMGYSEKRVPMGRTAFGTSAKAYKIAQLIRSTVRLARRTLVL